MKTKKLILSLFALLSLSLAACGGDTGSSDPGSGGGPSSGDTSSGGGGGTVVPVTGVTLNRSALEITVGQTGTLTATVAPNNATDKTLSWATSAPTVATVSNGVVSALAVGTATITVASVADPTKTANCTVNVVPAPEDPKAKLVIGVAPGSAVNPFDDGDVRTDYSWKFENLTLAANDEVSFKVDDEPVAVLSDGTSSYNNIVEDHPYDIAKNSVHVKYALANGNAYLHHYIEGYYAFWIDTPTRQINFLVTNVPSTVGETVYLAGVRGNWEPQQDFALHYVENSYDENTQRSSWEGSLAIPYGELEYKFARCPDDNPYFYIENEYDGWESNGGNRVVTIDADNPSDVNLDFIWGDTPAPVPVPTETAIKFVSNTEDWSYDDGIAFVGDETHKPGGVAHQWSAVVTIAANEEFKLTNGQSKPNDIWIGYDNLEAEGDYDSFTRGEGEEHDGNIIAKATAAGEYKLYLKLWDGGGYSIYIAKYEPPVVTYYAVQIGSQKLKLGETEKGTFDAKYTVTFTNAVTTSDAISFYSGTIDDVAEINTPLDAIPNGASESEFNNVVDGHIRVNSNTVEVFLEIINDHYGYWITNGGTHDAKPNGIYYLSKSRSNFDIYSAGNFNPKTSEPSEKEYLYEETLAYGDTFKVVVRNDGVNSWLGTGSDKRIVGTSKSALELGYLRTESATSDNFFVVVPGTYEIYIDTSITEGPNIWTNLKTPATVQGVINGGTPANFTLDTTKPEYYINNVNLVAGDTVKLQYSDETVIKADIVTTDVFGTNFTYDENSGIATLNENCDGLYDFYLKYGEGETNGKTIYASVLYKSNMGVKFGTGSQTKMYDYTSKMTPETDKEHEYKLYVEDAVNNQSITFYDGDTLIAANKLEVVEGTNNIKKVEDQLFLKTAGDVDIYLKKYSNTDVYKVWVSGYEAAYRAKIGSGSYITFTPNPVQEDPNCIEYVASFNSAFAAGNELIVELDGEKITSIGPNRDGESHVIAGNNVNENMIVLSPWAPTPLKDVNNLYLKAYNDGGYSVWLEGYDSEYASTISGYIESTPISDTYKSDTPGEGNKALYEIPESELDVGDKISFKIGALPLTITGVNGNRLDTPTDYYEVSALGGVHKFYITNDNEIWVVAPVPTASSFYLVGDVNGWNYGTDDTYKLTVDPSDTNHFTIEIALGANTDIKVKDNLGGWYGGSGNGNVHIDSAGTYKVNFYRDLSNPGDIHVTVETIYYLVGDLNGAAHADANWNINPDLRLELNDANTNEYVIKGIELKKDDQFKVRSSLDGNPFIPDGNNYIVGTSGTYDLYFRPYYHSDWSGYFYLATH